MNSSANILISEIFGPTVQGEGALIGQPTVFVRTAGCDYHCTWCDTLHAVESRYRKSWIKMSAQDILERVRVLAKGHPLMISLSGGNPAIQPLAELISLGKSSGFSFALETQGSVAQKWFSELDVLTISPKPPSSGMETDLRKLQDCVEAAGKAAVGLKIVILDDADYLYARKIASLFNNLPVCLQPCNHTPPDGEGEGTVDTETISARMRWLVDKVLADQWYQVRVLPQLHVMLWGNKRGV